MSISPSFIISMEDDFLLEFDDLINEEQETIEDNSAEAEEEAFINSDIAREEIQTHLHSCLTACQAVQILTDTSNNINAQILLQQDLYRHTNPVNTRSLLDLPSFYHHYTFPLCDTFWMQLFFNQTTRQYYTKESTQLQSYVLLDNPNLIQRIDEEEINIDVPTVLGVFGNMRLEERRFGFMVGGQHVWDKWHARAYAPLYYLEHNFNLTDEEQLMLERSGLPVLEDPTVFARKHLIIDKFGFGDTRIEVGYMPIKNDCMFMRLGGLFTIPTGFPFVKGLYGTHFSKGASKPDFNLLNFLNLILGPVEKRDLPLALDHAADLLIDAVDRLSTMVLEKSMGNAGHLGLGVFADHQLEISPRATLRSKASLEYLLPRTEKRFYIRKKNPADFLDRDYTDCTQADENLAFLNEQLLQTLFPCMFETRIFPGYIFIWNTSVTYHGKKLDFQLGYDLWWQDKEKLGRIKAPESVQQQLRTDIAVKPGAYQARLFGDLIWKKQGIKRDWRIGLHLDSSIVSVGIGNDFTLALYFDATL